MPKDLKLLEAAMIKRYGEISFSSENVFYTCDLGELDHLIEAHLNWYARRYNGHRWEVRNGVKDKSFYGETLAEAFCRALLEMP